MGSAARYARAREAVLRICRGDADARTLRLEVLAAFRQAVGFDAYGLADHRPGDVGGVRAAGRRALPAAAARADPAEVPDRRQPVDGPALRTASLAGATAATWRGACSGGSCLRGTGSGFRLVGIPGPVRLLGFPGPVARRSTAVRGRGPGVPRGPCGTGHRGAPARPAPHLRPRQRRRARDGGRPGVGARPGLRPEPRETELVRHLAAGGDTREVAGQMFVSENTVQDHLKSVFAKTGLPQAGGTLLARALGT